MARGKRKGSCQSGSWVEADAFAGLGSPLSVPDPQFRAELLDLNDVELERRTQRYVMLAPFSSQTLTELYVDRRESCIFECRERGLHAAADAAIELAAEFVPLPAALPLPQPPEAVAPTPALA